MAINIRQEINIGNIPTVNSSTGSYQFGNGNTPLSTTGRSYVQLDTTQYVNPTYYFETVAKNAGGAGTLTVKLTRTGSGTVDATNTVTATTMTRQRVSFTPPAGQTNYYVEITLATSSSSFTVNAARIIVIDNPTTLTSTETQIELGGTGATAYTSTTAVAVTNPQYWLYTAANWDGTKTFFAEVTYRTASTNTATITLQEDNGSFASWADKVTIVSAVSNTTVTRARSTSFTPTDGRNYRIAVKSSTTKSSVTIYNAKVIVDQSTSFYINGSTVAATDTQAVWTNDANAFDGNITDGATCATVGSASSNALYAGGTTAPASGATIGTVYVRVYRLMQTAGGGSMTHVTEIYTASLGELLGTVTDTSTDSSGHWTAYTALSTPSGGWTWAKIQALEQKSYVSARSGTTDELRKVEIAVNGVTLLEPQYLLLNTADSNATGVQSYQTLIDKTNEWSGVTLTGKHAIDSDNASNSAKLRDIDAAADITSSTVTGANQQISGDIWANLTDGNQIDTWILNTTGVVASSRLIVTAIVNPADDNINVSESSGVTDSISLAVTGGSTDLSVNVSDSSAVTELVDPESNNFVNKSDTSAVTENVIPLITSFINVSDTTGVTDTPKIEGNNFVNVSDSSGVTDTPSILVPFYNINVTDASGVTDSVKSEINSFINKSDSSGVTEFTNFTVTNNLNVNDSTGVTDAPKVEANNFINVNDTSAVTDSTTELIPTLFLSVSDTSSVSEAILLFEPEGVAVLDSSAITENVSLLIPNLFANVSDSSGVTENLKLLSEANVNKSDSSAVTDTPSVLIPFFVPNVSDSSAVTDTVKAEINDDIRVSDTSGVTDSTKTELNSFINVSDSSAVTENTSVLIPTLLISVSDSSSVSEAILLLDTDGIGVTDNSGVTDSVNVLVPFYNVNTSDSSAVTDSTNELLISNVNVTDNSSVTDSTQELVTSFINVSDSTGVSENINITIGTTSDLNINVSDSSAITENVSLLIPTLLVNKSDSSAITEALLLLDTDGIAVLDSTGVTENSSVLIPTLLVSVSDSSAVSENTKAELNSFINKSESSGVTENVSVSVPFYAPVVSDSVGTGESLKVESNNFVSVSDTSAVTDSATVYSDENILVSDGLAISDTPSVSFISEVNVSDSSAVTDSITVQEAAQSAYSINVSDTTAVTEFKHVVIAGTATTSSPQVIFLTDGRTAVRLANNLYLPL